MNARHTREQEKYRFHMFYTDIFFLILNFVSYNYHFEGNNYICQNLVTNDFAMYNKFKQHSDHKKKLFGQFTFIWSIKIQLSTGIMSGRKSKQEIGKDKTLGALSPLPGCFGL